MPLPEIDPVFLSRRTNGSKHEKAAFYYGYGGRNEALDEMRRWFASSPGLIILTGDQGSGRTTLLHVLVKSFNPDETDWCLLPEGRPPGTEEELFQALAEGFGLECKPVEILEDLIERVEHFIRNRLQEKHTLLILADDAGSYAPEAIAGLLRLARQYSGLSLVMVGEPGLLDTVRRYPGESLSVHRVALRPLLAEEIVGFFQQYLGYYKVETGRMRDSIRVGELMHKTGGNLSLLVRQVDQMIPRKIRLRKEIARFPKGHMIALAMVVGFTLLTFLYYPDQGKEKPDPAVYGAVGDGQDAAVDHAAVGDAFPEDSDPDIQEAASAVGRGAPVLIPPETLYTAQEQALLDIPAERFTLQIANLASEKKIGELASLFPAADQSRLYYYRREAGTKTLYIVVYGNYADKQAALGAEQALPAYPGKSSSWPRQMAEIQQELRHRQH
jgi:type II secretory pathway predicted ATPase ExeA